MPSRTERRVQLVSAQRDGSGACSDTPLVVFWSRLCQLYKCAMRVTSYRVRFVDSRMLFEHTWMNVTTSFVLSELDSTIDTISRTAATASQGRNTPPVSQVDTISIPRKTNYEFKIKIIRNVSDMQHEKAPVVPYSGFRHTPIGKGAGRTKDGR